MAHSTASNYAEKLLRQFTTAFEANKVLLQSVNTSIFDGKYDATTGGTVSVKRPHQGRVSKTTDGDLSAATQSDIQAGKVTGYVQNRYTMWTTWNSYEEALELDQLDEILRQLSGNLLVTLETDLQKFALYNAGLCFGDFSNRAKTWGEVGRAGALLASMGVPLMDNYYVLNPFSNLAVSESQAGLNNSALVASAWERAQLARTVGGSLQPMVTRNPTSWTSATLTDRAGTLSATPDATYVTAKDTYRQSVAVTGFTSSTTIKAGDVIEYTGRYLCNPVTHEIVYDEDGVAVPFRQTVVSDATMTTGAATLTVTPAAIYESNGQYNNISAALTSGDVVTLLGASATSYQPNLMFHKDALGVAFVDLPLPKGTPAASVITEDQIAIRVVNTYNGTTDKTLIRFDIQPIFAVFNPLWVGKAFGQA